MGSMKNMPMSKIRLDTYQILSVLLVAAVAVLLGSQWAGHNLQAHNVSDYIVSATLGDDQPASVSQKPNQRIAQFKLSTDSPEPVKVKGLEFYALGDLKNKIIRQLNIVPLQVKVQDAVIGAGDTWIYDYGRIYQIVTLKDPVILIKNNPAVVDIYADLTFKSGRTFGVSLIGIDSPLVAEGTPLDGYVRKIKVF
jgi:hypothetical protein